MILYTPHIFYVHTSCYAKYSICASPCVLPVVGDLQSLSKNVTLLHYSACVWPNQPLPSQHGSTWPAVSLTAKTAGCQGKYRPDGKWTAHIQCATHTPSHRQCISSMPCSGWTQSMPLTCHAHRHHTSNILHACGDHRNHISSAVPASKTQLPASLKWSLTSRNANIDSKQLFL